MSEAELDALAEVLRVLYGEPKPLYRDICSFAGITCDLFLMEYEVNLGSAQLSGTIAIHRSSLQMK